MARPLRIQYPGAVYHAMSRGNAYAKIYQNRADRSLFLDVLASVGNRAKWICHAYCLMDNHYHLLVETPEGNLSWGMRQLNGVYTQRYNRRHRTTGHVFQGRYKAVLVEKENHLLELCRYVVLNPVRARRVKAPETWEWSSYRATAGLTAVPAFLQVDWILAQFGRSRTAAQKHYRTFVEGGIRAASPWSDLPSPIALGSDSFVQACKRYVQHPEMLSEVPKPQRLIGRPSLEALGKKLIGKPLNKRRRDRWMYEAHVRYGYSLKDIGASLQLHYTTVSKAVNMGNKKTDISRPDPKTARKLIFQDLTPKLPDPKTA